MRILFVCDYFPPYIIGGGEISAYWQVKKLLSPKTEIITLAPRFSDNLKIKQENFKRYWYNLPFKLKVSSPIIFINPIFILYLFINILRILQKEKIDLIHCQAKYSAPASILVKLFVKIPVVLTLRDYRGLCNHGFCLYNNIKSCNLITFFRKDFLFYFKNYIKDHRVFSFVNHLIISYFGRINTRLLSFFMKKADKYICVSDYIKEVYITNGFMGSKMQTIYNFMPQYNESNCTVPTDLIKIFKQYQFIVLYAGKLSLGKGANLLINAAQEIIKKRTDVIFVFAGKLNYPINPVQHKQILFLNSVEYRTLLAIMKASDLVCIPSVWPEPLSRVVIEAFSLKKPVLASTSGGSKELINDQRGWLFKPNQGDLIMALNKALKDKNRIKAFGMNGFEYIKNLEKENLNKLLSLYQFLL